MRTVTEIQREMRAIEHERKPVDTALFKELQDAMAREEAERKAIDQAAGRTNACNSSWRIRQIEQDEYGMEHGELTCWYCGSMHPEAAVKFLQQPGTRFSGSDWKYGWPHKFYIEPAHPFPDKEYKVGTDAEGKPILGKRAHQHGKFYNNHLKDATPEVLAKFAELSEKIFGITWGKDEEHGVFYRAPKSNSFYGYQRAGEIQADGTPLHTL